MGEYTELAKNSGVEQILRSRLNAFTVKDVSEALERGKIDPAAAIKVVQLKEELVNGELIRDSGAVVLPNTRVNAHVHTGGDDPASKELKGLEAYKVLGGEGEISLGYIKKQRDRQFVRNEDNSIKVDYDAPVAVRAGDFIIVKPDQVHSLRNTGEENLTFVFTGSPKHLGSEDRIMVANPPNVEPQI